MNSEPIWLSVEVEGGWLNYDLTTELTEVVEGNPWQEDATLTLAFGEDIVTYQWIGDDNPVELYLLAFTA